MKIDNKFEIGQTVYLKHDKDQLPRMVTAIIVRPGALTFELSGRTAVSNHYDFEVSDQPDVMMSSTN